MKRTTKIHRRIHASPPPRTWFDRAMGRLGRSLPDLDRSLWSHASLIRMIALAEMRNEARGVAGDQYGDIERAAAQKFVALSQWGLVSYADCLRLAIDDYRQFGRVA